MELMSSLLLCALATLVPQALGKNTLFGQNAGVNDSVIPRKESLSVKDNILNMKSPLTIKVKDLKSVFMDVNCQSSLGCIERPIESHKVYSHFDIVNENFNGELLNREGNIRDKRQLKEGIPDKVDKKKKKSKSKQNKSLSIVKYNNNDKVYALKITESNPQLLPDQRNTNKTITCQVYSVKKSFPCESPEADLILKESKRKINKKSKKEHKREKNASDVKTTVIAPVFRKRQIDDSQAPEQIMPSIEELY